MPAEWEQALERWRAAELIDPAAADRIRAFEAKRGETAPPAVAEAAPQPGSLRWPAIVALAFGGLMLGAGVLLFVAAHWDTLSPGERFALVIAMVAVFHGAGGFAAAKRSENFAILMHGLGTASLGAGIFLAAQIFNLQAHWPSGVMLWAAGAWVGYALRRDWVQFGLAAILSPYWLAGEWIEQFQRLSNVHIVRVLGEGFTLLALTYLAARTRELKQPHRKVLVWIGAFGLLPSAIALAAQSEFGSGSTTAFGRLEWIGYIVAFALPLALAAWLRGRDASMNLIAAAWVFLLGLISSTHNAGVYAWCALGAAGLVAWGIRDGRSERINMGMASFAVTLLFFYFSEVMDKIGRSASLMGLGLLFLGGGWALERMRRRFVAQVRQAS